MLLLVSQMTELRPRNLPCVARAPGMCSLGLIVLTPDSVWLTIGCLRIVFIRTIGTPPRKTLALSFLEDPLECPKMNNSIARSKQQSEPGPRLHEIGQSKG